MADIYFYQDDEGDDADGAYCDGDSATGGVSADELLPPLPKLEKYAESENIFNRQIVARTVLETLRVVVDDANDVAVVLQVMNKLADDVEPSVRAELMEQVPHIAMFCQEFKLQLSSVVPDHLLPMVVKFLTDTNNQVRKTSQAALLVLLEQGLVEKSDVQDQVCPVIIRLTEPDSLDDYRTEAVALLSKMAPLIGKEMVEELFLDRFASLCLDSLFQVRKLCAANFGDFSSVVGSEATEAVLLPKFFYLCEDGVWGVRKACADVFMPVSCVCSPSVRRSELSPLFVNLLRDQSRWVRMAAFQALGPFISTFADPSITALLHNDNGEIVITEPETLARRLDELEEERKRTKEQNASKSVIVNVPEDQNCDDVAMDESEDEDVETLWSLGQELSLEERRARSLTEGGDSSLVTNSSPSSEEFNSFRYWREPLQTIELEEGDEESPDAQELTKVTEQDGSEEKGSQLHSEGVGSDDDDSKMWRTLPIITFQTFDNLTDSSEENSTMELFRAGGQRSGFSSTFDPRWDSLERSRDGEDCNNSEQQTSSVTTPQQLEPLDPALPRGPPLTEQKIVPQLLVDHYVSMIDPSRAQTVDSEIARHCAFSLPAVALTLGRANWPLLRDTYETLASDMQWKVRRTLASSIHELGVILGEEAAGEDLIPIFNGFLKDLDEVRQGLLKHLADFIRLLGEDHRREYLPKLSEFLKMDNERNWRFRQELAEQLERLIPLYSADDVEEHISPIAMVLVHDKVAAVRHTVTGVIAAIVLSLVDRRPLLADSLLRCAVQSLAKESLWVHRQTFASLCLQLHAVNALPPEQFAEKLLFHLLDLAEDVVPNVRLSVARTLINIKEVVDAYRMRFGPRRVEAVERNLRNDPDGDVRYIFEKADRKLDEHDGDFTDLSQGDWVNSSS